MDLRMENKMKKLETENREQLLANYCYGQVEQDVYKEVVKILKKEREKACIKELKSLKKNKREIRRNARTRILR